MSVKLTFISFIILSLLISISGLTLYYSWGTYSVNRLAFWSGLSGMIAVFVINATPEKTFTQYKFYQMHLKGVLGVCIINGIYYATVCLGNFEGLELIITCVYLLLLILDGFLRYSEIKN